MLLFQGQASLQCIAIHPGCTLKELQDQSLHQERKKEKLEPYMP